MIWFMRHGDAEEGEPDSERRLTAKGEQQARASGETLLALGARIELCLASPKVRATDTARIACDVLGVGYTIEQRLRGGNFDAQELAAGIEEVLLVGHEPDLSNAIHELTAESVDMKKGAIAGVEGREVRVHPASLKR